MHVLLDPGGKALWFVLWVSDPFVKALEREKEEP